MAVATFESCSYCFDQVQNACDAIAQGEAAKAEFILTSVRADARILQSESKKYYEGLKRLEDKQRTELELLTEKLNDLFEQEQKCSKQERELGVKKEVCRRSRESEEASYRDAQRRYQDAQRKKDEHLNEFNERREKLNTWGWVPFYNVYLLIEELVAEDQKKARDAQQDMDYYQNRSTDAEREMDRLSNEMNKAKADIKASMDKQHSLKQHRHILHERLGNTKKTSVFLLEASTFWDDIASLSDTAALKSGRLESIMSFAAKQNKTVEVLKSNGTKTLVRSFKGHWMELEDMLQSNDLVFAADDYPLGDLQDVQRYLGDTSMRRQREGTDTWVDKLRDKVVLNTIALFLVLLLCNWLEVISVPFSTIYHSTSFLLSLSVNCFLLVFRLLYFALYNFIALVFVAIVIFSILLAIIWAALYIDRC